MPESLLFRVAEPWFYWVVNPVTGGTDNNPFGSGPTITATDITIEFGWSINADGQGFCNGHGPGAGIQGGGDHATGGGYGGSGRDDINGDPGGSPHGAATSPAALGSAGGYGQQRAQGGCGGGAIKITASGTVTVDGTLSANGTSPTGSYYYNGGGSSGGSIWIESGTLTGTGQIAADGADDTTSAGGGRIDVSGTTNNFTGSRSSNGGTGFQNGQAGTILP